MGIDPQIRAATAPLPAQWTFWCDTYVSPGQFAPLGPVQACAFTCTRTLSAFGSGEIDIVEPSLSLTAGDVLNLWGWRVWALYDSQPVFCGMPTGVTDDGTGLVKITLTEISGYLTKRQWDQTADQVYTNYEQTLIASDIAQPVTDVGVWIGTSAASPVLISQTYTYLSGQSRGDMLTSLAGLANGIQFRTDYHVDSTGLPGASMLIAYPRAGTDGDLAARVPGNEVSYSLAWDADQLRTRTYAVGGQDPSATTSSGTTPPNLSVMVDRPQASRPRLDAVDDYSDVTVLSALQASANTSATIYADPVLAATTTVQVDYPPVNTYAPGDSVTLSVTGPLEPAGFDFTGWLKEISVNAADGTAQWTVTTTQPPGMPRATLIGQLAALRRLTTGIHRQRVAAPA